jgi:hypothetical protein
MKENLIKKDSCFELVQINQAADAAGLFLMY